MCAKRKDGAVCGFPRGRRVLESSPTAHDVSRSLPERYVQASQSRPRRSRPRYVSVSTTGRMSDDWSTTLPSTSQHTPGSINSDWGLGSANWSTRSRRRTTFEPFEEASGAAVPTSRRPAEPAAPQEPDRPQLGNPERRIDSDGEDHVVPERGDVAPLARGPERDCGPRRQPAARDARAADDHLAAARRTVEEPDAACGHGERPVVDRAVGDLLPLRGCLRCGADANGQRRGEGCGEQDTDANPGGDDRGIVLLAQPRCLRRTDCPQSSSSASCSSPVRQPRRSPSRSRTTACRRSGTAPRLDAPLHAAGCRLRGSYDIATFAAFTLTLKKKQAYHRGTDLRVRRLDGDVLHQVVPSRPNAVGPRAPTRSGR